MKEFQAKTVLSLGAEEIDMVMNIPVLKNGEKEVFIAGVVRTADGKIVKVILENCYLTEEEKRRACEWIVEAGADFVKTATAYAEGGDAGRCASDVRRRKGKCSSESRRRSAED